MGNKSSGPSSEPITVGYHKIRGLAGPLRMMCYYKKQPFINEAYGADMKEKWFGEKKPELLKQNSCINLPYIIDGEVTVTQSNTCCLYLGKRLGIDTEPNELHNHTVLDQTMDLRNDLMGVVYPFGAVKTKEEFPEAAKKYLEGSAKTIFTKLEGFCKGPYMCGAAPQSGDFSLWEMLDQHSNISKTLNGADILDDFPKLKALHAGLKGDAALAAYFESDMYKYAQNNPLPPAHYTGLGDDASEYGPTVTITVKF